MLRNYLKIAFRNLVKNKVYSFINIGGLAVGMAVAMLIGLWIWDELSFNKSFKNYERIGQLYQNRTFDGKIGTYNVVPMPLGKEFRTNYPDFKEVSMANNGEHIIAFNETKITKRGMYVEPAFTKMFSLEMLNGVQNGLEGGNAIMLSKSLAHALFDDADPIGKTVRIDNKINLAVTGVFQNFSKNSEFAEIEMLASWAAYLSVDNQARASVDYWGNNDWQCYVQLNESASLSQVQAKVKPLFYSKLNDQERARENGLF